MPEQMQTPKEITLRATFADDLEIHILPNKERIICKWKTGVLDGNGKLVAAFTDSYAFENTYDENGQPVKREFTQLAQARSFVAIKTNYRNIRDTIYGALKLVGKI